MFNLSLKDHELLLSQKYTKPDGGIPKEDLSEEIQQKLEISLDIEGYLLKGTANFNSTTGTIINHTIGRNDYKVAIFPTSNPNGYLGEYWVEKAMNSFIVKCSGTTAVSFNYIVF